MLDRHRVKKGLVCQDLTRELRANDLISIEDSTAKVHIVFSDGATICRPSILGGGTARRETRTWEILGTLNDYAEFRKAVIEVGRVPCSHCLARYK